MASSTSSRSAAAHKKTGTMRPPPARTASSRARTVTPTFNGRASPADSRAPSKTRTPKLKGPSESDHDGGEETSINVVVRCRGRNDREVRENSGVVISTDGIKGKTVDLCMGPTALNNKTYQFDKVFSPAADQGMIFNEVVAPILDEVLAGFNCTIFAYGQTGTGKTYTMSGDISDMLPIPDAAGIIPRVLHTLFSKLEESKMDKQENSVKCSFIELYNEELRDLLSTDDNIRLKIFDDTNKAGRSTTLVQGMEETHIADALKGIQLLREGSHKRQVAATKCNDLSSRSHTVFTITVYVKRTSESGEEYVSAGKLNLVDLAGSENIQRSGAENKRAAEAGLINKSLLTLGRVINALVDKGSHIPYRESKLTRLLQDSLGGRTKTCIIATLSPAKSNLEETISTLDYAFRAKNIRNKPQLNQMVSKKTLLREFTTEIEKLKSELIVTRQRNGVYLTAESYEEITSESESRRILNEEQKDKIETIEANLRNKSQELIGLTTNFQSLKREHVQARSALDGTKDILAKTELVLVHARKSLAEETTLRIAHEQTEQKLADVGEDLLSTLETTADHVDRLHSKLRRRSDLQSMNRSKWIESQNQVSGFSDVVEECMEIFRNKQQASVTALADRMQEFVGKELEDINSARELLEEKSEVLRTSASEVSAQTGKAKDDMDRALEDISALREDVNTQMGAGLADLSAAAQRISAGLAGELNAFHYQLQDSYASLGREVKTLFDDILRRMAEQQAEAARLREYMVLANQTFAKANTDSHANFERIISDERATATLERSELLAKIATLVNDSAMTQQARLDERLESANKRVRTSYDEYRQAEQQYGTGMDEWTANAQSLAMSSAASRDSIKNQMQADWSRADAQTTQLAQTATSIHGETVRIVQTQVAQMDNQLMTLDDFLNRVRMENEKHHVAHTSSIEHLLENVQTGFKSIGSRFEDAHERTALLDSDIKDHVDDAKVILEDLADTGVARQALSGLRDSTRLYSMTEYEVTGDTPAKTQYTYPSVLPRTEDHDKLLERMRSGFTSPNKVSGKRSPSKHSSSPLKRSFSPSKTSVFSDLPELSSRRGLSAVKSLDGLRELDADASTDLPAIRSEGGMRMADENKRPVSALRRLATNPLAQSLSEARLPSKRDLRTTMAGTAEGRENVPLIQNFSASVGPGIGRRLRSGRGGSD